VQWPEELHTCANWLAGDVASLLCACADIVLRLLCEPFEMERSITRFTYALGRYVIDLISMEGH
jgi:hypothetical protein